MRNPIDTSSSGSLSSPQRMFGEDEKATDEEACPDSHAATDHRPTAGDAANAGDVDAKVTQDVPGASLGAGCRVVQVG
jgi:hypothetical protein